MDVWHNSTILKFNYPVLSFLQLDQGERWIMLTNPNFAQCQLSVLHVF